MKFGGIPFVFLLAAGTAFGQFPPQLTRVVVIVQENRTPDNLFHFLTPACPIPAGTSGLSACIPEPVISGCYDISPCGLSNQKGVPAAVPLKAMPLSANVNPNHSHDGFNKM